MKTQDISRMILTYDDAASEEIYAPDVLRHAFVDIPHISNLLSFPGKFIIHGPKGSGKTAIASRARLLKGWDKFVAIDNMSDYSFSVTTNKHISPLSTWKVTLLLRIALMLSKDEELMDNTKLQGIVNTLKKFGLLADSSIEKITKITSSIKWKLPIATLLGMESSDVNESTFNDPDNIAHSIMINLIKSIPKDTPKRYELYIDGLDYALTVPTGMGELRALIMATIQLNKEIHTSTTAIKIILLLRDEILEILPTADRGKFINDHGINLNWYNHPNDPLRSELSQIIKNRADIAQISCDAPQFWAAWLPELVQLRPAAQYIFERTRFLPRDIVAIFRQLQAQSHQIPFSQQHVLSALALHSDWLLEEYKNSIHGTISHNGNTDQGNDLITLLPTIISDACRTSGLPPGRFRLKHFEEALRRARGEIPFNAITILDRLFLTNWIGNYSETEYRLRITFRYRNRYLQLDPNGEMLVHFGIRKALNLT